MTKDWIFIYTANPDVVCIDLNKIVAWRAWWHDNSGGRIWVNYYGGELTLEFTEYEDYEQALVDLSPTEIKEKQKRG